MAVGPPGVLLGAVVAVGGTAVGVTGVAVGPTGVLLGGMDVLTGVAVAAVSEQVIVPPGTPVEELIK